MPQGTGQELQKVGDYDLVEKIAEGGMGTVYKGRHRATGDAVAIKVVPPQLAANPIYAKRFEQEYNAARTLSHPNIVRAVDFGREGASPFLVMEFVEGETLGQRLERDGRLPEAEAVRIISEVAQGLHRAHLLGLVHRDVKPDNIMLTPAGEVKLTDLGLVKEIDSDLNLTRTGRGLGTPHFMAPEQFRRAKDADARCDIYSMAATLYMMVTGELPFKGCGPVDAWMRKVNHELPHASELAPDLSERLDWAIRRSMSADPAKRPATCIEFVEDLTGQGTRRLSITPSPDTVADDEWHLVYHDDEKVVHSAHATTESIRRSLREGLLGDAGNVRISRLAPGPFEPLRLHPEFRDLIIAPTPLPAGGPRLVATPLAIGTDTAPRPESVPTQIAIMLPPAAPAPATAGAPHFDLGPANDDYDSTWWMTAIMLAMGASAGGYVLVRLVAHLRLW